MARPKPATSRLSRFFHYRWCVPALAAFDALGGHAKFVTLQRRLDVNRGSLQRTLGALVEAGLVSRNTGYGHPLRPEYLLTLSGRTAASLCAVLVAQLEQLGVVDLALRKWSLPVARAVARSGGRFNRLRTELGTVTPRALAQALRDLQEAGLIERQLVDDSPPRADYHLTDDGRRVADLTSALALVT